MPTFDEVFAVMAAATAGRHDARVDVGDAPDIQQLPTRFGMALNVLLRDLEERTAAHKVQVATIVEQHKLIVGLSLPVLAIEEGVLLLPVIGALDSQRVGLLLDVALAAIHESGATVLVIDLTGVLALDEVAAGGLARTAHAAALLGATTLVCGIRARVALAMQAADVAGLHLVATLRAGIAEARRLRGGPPRGCPAEPAGGAHGAAKLGNDGSPVEPGLPGGHLEVRSTRDGSPG